MLLRRLFSMGNSSAKGIGPAYKAALSKKHGEPSGNKDVATFAAGCFWGVELAFQRIPGVIRTQVGYLGGNVENPTYEDVCTGRTGHTEAVQVTFDPEQVTYPQLLGVFWERHDPTTKYRQGNDQGTQYRAGIFYHNKEQQAEAIASRDAAQEKFQDTPVVTEITEATVFYPAEDYHQQYLEKKGQTAGKGRCDSIRCYG